MKYFRMLDDLDIPGRWFLGNINFKNESDIWDYIGAGEVLEIPNDLNIEKLSGRKPLDLTMAEFDLLIANNKVSKIFKEREIQKIPINIKGSKNIDYSILVIKKEIDCIDRMRSTFTIWEKNNLIRPDLAGTYENFNKIVVDVELMRGVDICRIENFNVAIIVSEKVVNAFWTNGINGVKFIQV